MTELKITRTVRIPEPLKIARYLAAPQLGPRSLFFSGGSALRSLSQKLIDYTHNSVHIITSFDSGGSSAAIRDAFGILSVGDFRNRIMALADQTVRGNPAVYNLFAYRLPVDESREELEQRLWRMAHAKDSMIVVVPNPMRRIIRNHLHYFLERMPMNFDLRGASIGNLVLTGGYLNNRRHIDPVIFMFSRLVEARGIVKPITGLSYHLGVQLNRGKNRLIVGQHRITQKNTKKLNAKIERLFLTKTLDSTEPVMFTIKNKIKRLIRDADLICFPMGSFYTSVVANLLPEGVGEAIAQNDAPKVFVPNPTFDPEQYRLSFYDSVHTLISYARAHIKEDVSPLDLLNVILIDSKNGNYAKPMNLKKLKSEGFSIVDEQLITPQSAPYFDEKLLIEVLLSLT